MKLRIRGSSLRFRLTQGEVAALAEGKSVQDAVDLGGEPFVYEVVPDERTDVLAARAAPWRITLAVPGSWAKRWAASDEVGLEGTTRTGAKLLIEKDFACVKPRGEGEEDAFPNPDGGKC